MDPGSIIVNDGSGLNFELSHGSDGASSGDGRIEVTFNKVSSACQPFNVLLLI